MAGAGSDPDGSDPASRLEAARRRLYMPGGEQELGAFLEATALEEVPPPPSPAAAPVSETEPPDEPAAEPEATPSRRSRRRTLVLILAPSLLVVIVAAFLLQAVGPRPLPERVSVPALAGSTLLTYHRRSNPESAPRFVTFEPADYDIYDPHDRRVGVALHCIGTGTVRIRAGGTFSFRCTPTDSVQVQRTDGAVTDRFLILGRTTGNVVWSVRVVLLPTGTVG